MNMAIAKKQIDQAVEYIRTKVSQEYPVGIILGTGLQGLTESMQIVESVPYQKIPGFVNPTVEMHGGELLFARLAGKHVVCMKGRFHFYEGYSMDQITFPVRVMRALGAKTLIVSNVAGTVQPDFRAGSLMMIEDHINLLGQNPLIGPNDESLGPRWPDMSDPYTKELREIALQAAKEAGIHLHEGVYACMSGPNLETRAEYRMLQRIGADVIGMSTVPEVITAVHAGMSVLGFSVITDECYPDSLEPAELQKILAHAAAAEPLLVQIITGVLRKIGHSK